MPETTFVYLIGRPDGPIKFGITTNLTSRLRAVQQDARWGPLQILWVVSCEDSETARELERQCLEYFPEARLSGEWVDVDFDLAHQAITDCWDCVNGRRKLEVEESWLSRERGKAVIRGLLP
jgi:hypothetical protein